MRIVLRKINREGKELEKDKIRRQTCKAQRSEPVPLERGCSTSFLPLQASHAPMQGQKIRLYIYIHVYMLIQRQPGQNL